MSATTSPSEKFAFLFKTSNANESLNDIKTTLKEFYGYPDSNIIESTGCGNFINDVRASGSMIPIQPIGQVPHNETPRSTLVIMITGETADATGLNDTTGAVSWDDIMAVAGGEIPGNPPEELFNKLNVEVNVIVTAPHAGALMNNWTTNSNVAYGTLLISHNDTNDQIDSAGRQNFLNIIRDLLQMKQGSTPDSVTGMQSFNKIGDIIHGPGSNYFATAGSDECFPGRPHLLIRDDPSSIHLSPDIRIEHPLPQDSQYNNSSFESGFLFDDQTSIRNIVRVEIRNTGTHPLGKLTAELGIYRQSTVIPGQPDLYGIKTLNQVFKADGNPVIISFDNIRFQQTDYSGIVAIASYSGNSDFSLCDIGGDDNVAMRNIAFIIEILDFQMSQVNVYPAGANNGSITITITGGDGPYTCECTGVSTITVNNNSQPVKFQNLSPGLKVVTVTDSSNQSVSKETTITEPGPVVCVTRLNNNYINICRTYEGDLKITFKPLISVPVFRGSRRYKIRFFRPPIFFPHFPYPHVSSELFNASLVATGTETADNVSCLYSIIEVPDNRTGRLILRHPSGRWPFGRIPLKIPAEILLRRYPFILTGIYSIVARFTLVIYSNSLDIEP